MKKQIAILPGDGIGPEIMAEALKVLDAIASKFHHEFLFQKALIGGAAWDQYENHFPEETLNICEESDAILFGSVGGPLGEQYLPKWEECEKKSILALRKKFCLNINFRPVKLYSALIDKCVLRKEKITDGVDILCVRELSEGIYFGKHETVGTLGQRLARDEMFYNEKTIETIAHAAFQAAMTRRKKVTSVDKANVLDCSKLWRKVVTEVSKQYPTCQLEHQLVDNCAMQLLIAHSDYDVLLAPNMFGDILSDEISIFAGSLGMLPSASFNQQKFGFYEPSGGSAPAIAGKGIANPIGQILSAAMMLKYSFGMHKEHDIIQQAIKDALNQGLRTVDLSEDNAVSTQQMGNAIIKNIMENTNE